MEPRCKTLRVADPSMGSVWTSGGPRTRRWEPVAQIDLGSWYILTSTETERTNTLYSLDTFPTQEALPDSPNSTLNNAKANKPWQRLWKEKEVREYIYFPILSSQLTQLFFFISFLLFLPFFFYFFFYASVKYRKCPASKRVLFCFQSKAINTTELQ